ncbi:hypothetical protein GH714_002284 [Hevea brasiliensis]|uniref:CASP-like protein n=1 Tax=Hevea brasiliensis TaxID=3981 RepID=A0A6A6KJS7_HEVBR|nr:hypothetical protein GH714_002284 [Hevea brasiliensis]
MDSQNYVSHGGMDGVKDKEAKEGGGGTSFFLLRVMALLLTLVAAIVLGVDKQNKVIPIKIVDSLPPLNIPVVAKWHYLSAFVKLITD